MGIKVTTYRKIVCL